MLCKSCNTCILQHSVTFNERNLCQIWYHYFAQISKFWAKLRPGYFRFSDFCSIPYKTVNDNCLKHGPVTKLDKKNTAASKNLTMTSCRQTATSLSFFRFMTNLELSGSRIRDALSVIFPFSLMVTFYLTKTESRTKDLQLALILLLWVKLLFLPKNDVFCKKCWH